MSDIDNKTNEKAKVVLTLKEYASEIMRAYVEGFNAAKAILDAADISKMDITKAFEEALQNHDRKEDQP